MKYIDCLIMNAGLQHVKGPGMKARFTYKVARNKRLIEPVIKSLDEMVKPSDDHKKYTDARQKLLKEFAKKDENGDPTMQTRFIDGRQQESYVIPGIGDDKSDFNVKMDKLKEEYEKVIDDQKEREEKYDEHLDEECDDFTPYMVDWNLIPENLPQEAMDGVHYMIKESETESKPKSKRKTPASKKT